MKKQVFTIVLTLLIILGNAQQAPQALNYQAVARTANGLIIPTQNISVRFSILDGTVNGPLVFQETHTTATNNYGLFILAIGRGTLVSGTFAAVNWGNSDKFLKVEIAADGTTNYQLQGTTQLLSVPYSLYSERTKLLAGNNTINITNGNTITGNYLAANNTVLVNGNTIAGNYQPANNTILVNGNTIAGNYQAGNSTVLVSGNSITGNYQAANNTVLVNGNTIAGNYQAANNTILVNGNTISSNYQPGAGINIAGNVISASGASLWIPDANGIRNISGNVGIGMNSHSIIPFIVRQPNTGVGNAVALFESDDIWHSNISLKNNTQNKQFSFVIGGSNNTELKPGNFGLANGGPVTRWAYVVDGLTNFTGFNPSGIVTPIPKSTIHIFQGDVNIEQIGSGTILKSPNGQCWRVTIDNAGNLVRTAITCP